ncbi:MAG: hypothetical protein ACFFBI_05245, partial [Promethearchaeota archaeon]
MEKTSWIIVCIIGGILMILGSTVGNVAFFETIYGLLSVHLTSYPILLKAFNVAMLVLGYIAAGGGISVIVGALLVAIGANRFGKIIIGIGAGMGLISFIIFLVVGIVGGTIVSDLEGIVLEVVNGGYGFLGVLLTIVARTNLKRKEEVPQTIS